jgi:hypothetical protein
MRAHYRFSLSVGLLLSVALLLLDVSAQLLGRVTGDGSDNSIYQPDDNEWSIRKIFTLLWRGSLLTLLSDDTVDGTFGILLGLSSLDLGLTLVVSFPSVLAQDTRSGRSTDGLVLRVRCQVRSMRAGHGTIQRKDVNETGEFVLKGVSKW